MCDTVLLTTASLLDYHGTGGDNDHSVGPGTQQYLNVSYWFKNIYHLYSLSISLSCLHDQLCDY